MGVGTVASVDKVVGFEKTAEKLKSKRLSAALRVQSIALKAACDFMHERGLVQLLPVVVSPVTDPLNHPAQGGVINYKGTKLRLTKSMILHKQLALAAGHSGVFVISPNVRFESDDKAETGRHLLEFSQFDFELRGVGMRCAMDFIEDLFERIFSRVASDCAEELSFLKRELSVPEKPFPVFEAPALRMRFGARWYDEVSKIAKKMFWVVDHEREFYDREDDARPGHFLNYDAVYPEGFGEALSGGEREFEYERILRRMKRNKTRVEDYAPYLAAAREGLLSPSAGAGFGIERLVRFVCGAEHVAHVSPFAKVPGGEIIF
ncbi:MAG: asparagine synthetase A [Candidatus Norongarragalinales archaeon]